VNTQGLKALAIAVLETEARAVQRLAERVDERFEQACELLLRCRGRIVVTGMGKSGHIASKIAATLASTGSPAFCVHPADAGHGDMGMITPADTVLMISNSGETAELKALLPGIKRLGAGLVTLCGSADSTLARHADVHLDTSVSEEACPLGLAPTASTTASLAMGDALAVALLESRGFTAEDFARAHPGGSLGRKLLLRIDDIMHTGEAIPRVAPDASISEALVEMTQQRLGMAAVVDTGDRMLGVFTDGDLRRALDGGCDLRQTSIGSVMTRDPVTIGPQALAVEAARHMQRHKVQGLLVIDDGELVGALNFQDLLQSGVV